MLYIRRNFEAAMRVSYPKMIIMNKKNILVC